MPLKLQNNEFARSRVGGRREEFRDGLGDIQGHSVSLNISLYRFRSNAFIVTRVEGRPGALQPWLLCVRFLPGGPAEQASAERDSGRRCIRENAISLRATQGRQAAARIPRFPEPRLWTSIVRVADDPPEAGEATARVTARWKRSRSVRRSRGRVGYISPFRYLARSTLIGIRYTLASTFPIALIADLAKARFQSSVGLKSEGNITLFVVSQ